MRVLKYALNTGLNTVRHAGTIKLVHMDYQDSRLMGWFTVTDDFDALPTEYEVHVALTGERVPDQYCYCCTAQLQPSGGYFVVHAFD